MAEVETYYTIHVMIRATVSHTRRDLSATVMFHTDETEREDMNTDEQNSLILTKTGR